MATSAIKILYDEGSAPATPAANKVVTYAKSDGKIYSKDDAGVETLMSGGPGGGSTPTFHGVRARASADTALTSGAVVYVGFDAADEYDTDAYHNPASNNTRLTVPASLAGYYHIHAGSFTSASPGAGYPVIRKNGTTIMGNGSYGADTGAGSYSIGMTLLLAVGDYVEFGIRVGAGSKSALDAGVSEAFFEMSLIGV